MKLKTTEHYQSHCMEKSITDFLTNSILGEEQKFLLSLKLNWPLAQSNLPPTEACLRGAFLDPTTPEAGCSLTELDVLLQAMW